MNSDDYRVVKRKNMSELLKTTGLKTAINDFQNVLDVICTNVASSIKFDSYIRPRIRTCPGTIASVQTLFGISELCEIEDFPDAYLLIRKLRDNLFLDLFLFEVQKRFEEIPSSSFNDIDLNNKDDLIKALDKFHKLCSEVEMNKDEFRAINKWKDGELLLSHKKDDKNYFRFHKYIQYLIEGNKDFDECHKTFLKGRFKK